MSSLENRKFAVTGGAGFIGSHVTDELVRRGAQVVVVDDLSVGEAANVNPRARLVRADVRDRKALVEAFRDVEGVFHLAVQCLRLSWSDPTLVHEVNATGTLEALRAAAEDQVSRFVYVSSSEVYGTAHGTAALSEESPLEPTTPYGASKAAGELYARSFRPSHGLATSIVRPFNSYGPRSHAGGPYGEVIPRFVACVLAGERPTIFGDGQQTRDFTYVEETAQGIVAAGLSTEAVGEAINVARGREVPVNELARVVARVCGRPDLEPVHEAARPADVRRHLATTEKASRLLGFTAKIDLEEGVRRYVEWVRARGPAVSAKEAKARNW